MSIELSNVLFGLSGYGTPFAQVFFWLTKRRVREDLNIVTAQLHTTTSDLAPEEK